MLALGYLFVVTWITSFVMVIVHDRVPDMKRYPPLPDIFLDNVPYIPWAFHMCEWTATVLVIIWTTVLIFHKYRYLAREKTSESGGLDTILIKISASVIVFQVYFATKIFRFMWNRIPIKMYYYVDYVVVCTWFSSQMQSKNIHSYFR